MSRHEADSVRHVAGMALKPMSASITELRAQGFHELANELTRVKEQWARKVMHYAQGRDAASRTPVACAAHAWPANVLPLQKPGSRARAPIEIPRRPHGDSA